MPKNQLELYNEYNILFDTFQKSLARQSRDDAIKDLQEELFYSSFEVEELKQQSYLIGFEDGHVCEQQNCSGKTWNKKDIDSLRDELKKELPQREMYTGKEWFNLYNIIDSVFDAHTQGSDENLDSSLNKTSKLSETNPSREIILKFLRDEEKALKDIISEFDSINGYEILQDKPGFIQDLIDRINYGTCDKCHEDLINCNTYDKSKNCKCVCHLNGFLEESVRMVTLAMNLLLEAAGLELKVSRMLERERHYS